MKAEGVNGFMELRGDAVILTRKFLFGKSKGAKSIALRSITAVQFRPASLLVSGFLQIAFSGSKESKGGIFDAAKDENTIMFNKSQQAAFATIRDEIEARRTQSPPPSPSLSGQLAELTALHEQGSLTTEEFAAAKARLLS